MTLSKKIYEVLFKPYSEDVRGYIVRIADFIHIVINSRLSKPDAEATQATLKAAAEKHPQHSFILLHGNGRIQKSEDFDIDILERAC